MSGLNTVVVIMLYVRLAQVFGKGGLDIFLPLFLTPIGLLKLLSKARHPAGFVQNTNASVRCLLFFHISS